MSKEFSERSSKAFIEEGLELAPLFDHGALVAAIAQDVGSREILMIAWMDAAALKATLDTGEAHYYSRSRARMWRKGESSGHVQKVHEVRVDCDQDAILLLVEQDGPGACHVGYRSCFFRRVSTDGTLETIGKKAYDPKAVYSESGDG